MTGQCHGIRGFLCQAVIIDLDYLIKQGIFTDDIQAIQFALTHITMEERIKEVQKLRAVSKWQEENV
ncbi:MAG: hypothetical protein C3F06_14325 [Candidatus Methanoperedenaceae archaeon]|nr:MAG: hypothetical protein C3F06_14325 [Candidatus Methanoperedenaceae archaeon]